MSVEPIGHFETDNNVSEQAVEPEEPEFDKQETIRSVQKKQSLRARYIYGFIFFVTNLFAWFIRDYGYKVLHHFSLSRLEEAECSSAIGVLRVSLGCFIFFSIMFAATFGTTKLHEARNSWHSRFWHLKSLLYIVTIIIPFIIPKAFIQLYGEIARIGAGIFLLLQLISTLHFIAWCNSHWMPDPQSHRCDFCGLFLSTISYTASVGGIIIMYIVYAPNPSCILNIFVITWTAVLVKVMMIVSLHSKVNEGLLSSGIMSSYIVFLCWSALQSEPQTGQCNTWKKTAKSDNWTTMISFLIAICSIVMATFSTGIDAKSFQYRNEEAQLKDDDIPYSCEIFHLVFSMGAMYFAMLFISWELDHPTRKWSIDVGWAGTWVKIINQWFAASLYLWKLLYPIMMREKANDHEESTQQIHP